MPLTHLYFKSLPLKCSMTLWQNFSGPVEQTLSMEQIMSTLEKKKKDNTIEVEK